MYISIHERKSLRSKNIFMFKFVHFCDESIQSFLIYSITLFKPIHPRKFVRHMYVRCKFCVNFARSSNLLFCFQMSLRSLAFNAATSTDSRSGLSLLHAACIDGDLEAIQIITSYSPGKLDNAIALTISSECYAVSFPRKNALEISAAKRGNQHQRIHKILQSLFLDFQSKSLLFVAARRGNCEHIRRLIDLGCNPNEVSRDAELLTPLMLAVTRNSTHFAELLINYGANINAKDRSNMTALHYASLHGKASTALILIEAGAGVCEVTDRWMTPLHFACHCGHTKTASILIEHGASVEVKSSGGCTPLLLATEKGHYETVEFLLAHGSSVHTAEQMGFTAIHLAAMKGHTDLVRLLLQRGSDVDVRASGKTPLFLSSFANHRETTELLLEYGSDVNAHDIFGRTAVHYGAQEGRVAMITLLLERGANVHARDQEGQTPLFMSVIYDQKEAASRLIQHGADVNAGDTNRKTPLHFAAQEGCVEIAEMLIENGANVNAEEVTGDQPLALAVAYCSDDVVALLLRHGAELNATNENLLTPLHIAAQNGKTALAEMLLQQGVHLESKECDGQTALHIACSFGDIKMAKVLVKYGSDVNARDGAGKTTLCLAVSEGHMEIAAFLLENGADVNLVDGDGYTPLHNLYMNLYKSLSNDRITYTIAELLFNHGSRIDERDRKGRTALHMACECSSVKLVEQLLQHKSKINAVDLEGCTPLMRSIRFSRRPDPIVKLLIDNNAKIAVKDIHGLSALHYAAGVKGLRKISQTLIEKGADVQGVDNEGNTTLHIAVNHRNMGTAELLINSESNLHVANNRNETALMKAVTAKCECIHGCRRCVWKYHTVSLLVEKGCDVKTRDNEGNTALHRLSECITDPTTVRLLLRNGADVRARNNQGSTPLHLICTVKCERSRAK